jgi:hypothetical protein
MTRFERLGGYIECGNCGEAYHPAEGVIEQHRCHAEGCEVILCANCGVTCDWCGQSYCAAHMADSRKLCVACHDMEKND